MSEKALQIQEKLNAIQQELHEALFANDEKLKQAQAKLFEDREKVIQECMQKGGFSFCGNVSQGSSSSSSPMSFWAKAIISGLKLYDKEDEENVHFLGPYDEDLLSKYLLSMKVTFSPHSKKLILEFKENPFFEETTLWAELHYPLEKNKQEGKEGGAATTTTQPAESKSDSQSEQSDEEEEEDEGQWTFSGITWKPGHGPEEEEDTEKREVGETKKRVRSEEEAAVVGPSMLARFSEMPPHPNNDQDFLDMLEEEFKDENDPEQAEMAAAEELEDAIQSWESEMDDREQLLSLLIEDIYSNPVEAILADNEEDEKDGEGEVEALKKAKTE